MLLSAHQTLAALQPQGVGYPDVIMEGNDIQIEYIAGRNFNTRENTSVQVR